MEKWVQSRLQAICSSCSTERSGQRMHEAAVLRIGRLSIDCAYRVSPLGFDHGSQPLAFDHLCLLYRSERPMA